jgi:hypothetical protein
MFLAPPTFQLIDDEDDDSDDDYDDDDIHCLIDYYMSIENC